jgi:hypothetical protein
MKYLVIDRKTILLNVKNKLIKTTANTSDPRRLAEDSLDWLIFCGHFFERRSGEKLIPFWYQV